MTLEDFLVEMSRYSGERREFLLMILSGDMLPELMSMQSRFIHTQHRLEADPVTWRFGPCTVCQRVEADPVTWRFGPCTVCQRVFDCKYLSCKICFNVLNYVFIVFIFNLYCLVNIQQRCHNSSHCD